MTKEELELNVAGTSNLCRYSDLAPNPMNPRRIFDKFKLDVLEESIRANGILVPLTVYRDRSDQKLYILDGERRWRCAQRIETGEVSTNVRSLPEDLKIPSEFKSTLSYEEGEKVLIHRVPVTEDRLQELLKLSSSTVWASIVRKLHRLSKERPPQTLSVPINVVDPPTPAANLLFMFHVHNLREQWELMPTALSLQTLMRELKETDDAKLSELTNLSEPHVKRCKILLSFPKKYQSMMLDPDPEQRLKANLFIEMHPVLDLYEEFGDVVSSSHSRNELTDLFIEKYRKGLIPSVLHFRKIIGARDELEEKDRLDEVKIAAKQLVSDPKAQIKTLFDPLTIEERKIRDATELCTDFITRLKKLKVAHTMKRSELIEALQAVRGEITKLLDALAGED